MTNELIPHVCIIAEAGVNHNGSLERALQMVDTATEAGADYVKFQTFEPEAAISRHAAKAAYQVRNTGESGSQLEMVRKMALGLEAHRKLIRRCEERNIRFLSTPFDLGSVRQLTDDLHISRLKVASGEITNFPLLFAIARTGVSVILSTGMSTIGEVEQALGVLSLGYTQPDISPSQEASRQSFASCEGQRILQEKVSLLHCTTEYPASLDSVNLRVMDTLRATFQLPVGLSDHTVGTSVAIAAAARGAVIIEKHFTLDKSLPGPDHKASLEPEELAAMISDIRKVESALGTSIKAPTECEIPNRSVARKSLVAARDIRKGEVFSVENLTTKRPGTGIPAVEYWKYLGRRASRGYALDDLIEESFT